MKFSIKDFFSKCDEIRSFLRIWSHLKKSLMENFIFCAVNSKTKYLEQSKEVQQNYRGLENVDTYFFAISDCHCQSSISEGDSDHYISTQI